MTLRILLVGEARGEREVLMQHGFVGPSGRELARMIAAAGLGPELRVRYPGELDMVRYWREARDAGIGIANVFEAHPPNNEILTFFDREGNRALPPFRVGGRVGYILPDHMAHVVRLWDLVRTEAPNIVVALGNTACWALLGQTRISELRGTLTPAAMGGLTVKVLPTFHPAAVLRQWSLRPIGVADLKKATREAQYPEIRRVERWITVPAPDASGIQELTQWFNRGAAGYANDIETAGGQISMTSFARSASDACVIPFQAPNGASFWPTPNLEVRAWRLALRGLHRPIPKTGQNWLYDLGYYARMGIFPRVSGPAVAGDDTMLRHHARYPEVRKSLGFLGSLYCSEISWKLMAKSSSLKRDE